MDDRIIEVLLEIKDRYGDAIFEDKKRLNNILKDLLIGDIKYEQCLGKINTLMYAVDERVYEKLIQYKDDPAKAQKYYINLLKNKYSINEEVALFGVNALSSVLGIKLIEMKISAKSRNQEKKQEQKRITEKQNPQESEKRTEQRKQIQLKKRNPKKSIIIFSISVIVISLIFAYIGLFRPLFENNEDNTEDEYISQSTQFPIRVSDFIFDMNDDNITLTLTKYEGHMGDIVIPATVVNRSIISIGYASFKDNMSLISVTIENGITEIGECAFFGCANLTNITIPNSVKYIRGSAFYGCTNLTSITIPDSVIEIGNLAFAECSSLTSINIPDNVESIDENAFYGCDNEDFKIICSSGSYIHYLCVENGIAFELID